MDRSSSSAAGIAACVVVVFAGSALARPEVPYASISGTTVNFDSLAGSPTLGAGEILTTQYSSLGVVFNVPNFGAYASTSLAAAATLQTDPNVIWVNQGGGGGGSAAQGIDMNFDFPVSGFAMWFGGSGGAVYEFQTYGIGGLIESFTKTGTSTGSVAEGQIGIAALQPITRVRVFAHPPGGSNYNFAFDDVKFTPFPAPSSAIALGVAGVIVGRRRR